MLQKHTAQISVQLVTKLVTKSADHVNFVVNSHKNNTVSTMESHAKSTDACITFSDIKHSENTFLMRFCESARTVDTPRYQVCHSIPFQRQVRVGGPRARIYEHGGGPGPQRVNAIDPTKKRSSL